MRGIVEDIYRGGVHEFIVKSEVVSSGLVRVLFGRWESDMYYSANSMPTVRLDGGL